MNQETVRTFLPVVLMLIAFVVSWATWVTVSHMKTKRELAELKLYVAENYARKELITEVFRKLDELSGIVHSIAGKLSVTIDKE